MKCRKYSIATGRIEGLDKPPYYFEDHCCYAWGITFSDTTTTFFCNLPCIYVGRTKEEGERFCDQLKYNFSEAHINEKDRVAVIFEDNGSVIAIARVGLNAWIDVNDKFKKKTFEELNIEITSLKVY